MKNLYALLVGINDYRSPISPLGGCLKDVKKIEKYINKNYSKIYNVNILKLINEEATYENVKKGFREHLRQANGDDVVWFHFSGHGSEEPTAKEFLSIEENGKDQTLLCYDSRKDEAYNLADKELAVLLHEVATTTPDGKPKESAPHTVVSLDACHSGSGTRSAGQAEEIRVRSAQTAGRTRPIDSYVDGFYAKQGENLQVPSSTHVVLSACQTYQFAGDLNNGGAFTSGLIRALDASKGQINYADLFIRSRSSVQNIRKNQTPYFSSLNNFNPYSLFMVGTDFGDAQQYEVFRSKGSWYIRCGAIHGLPTKVEEAIKVEIYSFPEAKLLGTATLDTVGAQQSLLSMDMNFQLKATWGEVMPGEDHYRGIIKAFPIAPTKVYIEGDEKIVSAIKAEDNPHNFYDLTERDDESHEIEISACDEIEIKDLSTSRIVFTTSNSEEAANDISFALTQMVKWHRFHGLKNTNTKSVLKNRLDFKLWVHDTQGNVIPHQDSEIKLYASDENSMGGKFGFSPKITIKDTSQDLHFYMMYLRPNYAIECPDDEVNFYANEHKDKKEVELSLWKEIKGFGPDVGQNSVTANFKLIVTTEPLDYFQFIQSGLEKTRSELTSWNPSKISDDWAVYDMEVTISRQENKISSSESVKLNDGQLVVKPHAAMSADISVSSESTRTRNATAGQNVHLLESNNFRLVNLSNSRDADNSSVLELNNINIDDYSLLKEQPLEISLAQKCEENEMIFPLVFDGKYFRIAGESEAEGDQTTVKITSLPEPAELKANNPESERSAFSSLKLAFFKLVLNDDKTNTMSLVEEIDGEYKLTRNQMAVKIMGAKKILLLVHGIFGDGLNLFNQVLSNNESLIDSYDCILAYNYECLHTPLDETAKLLKAELTGLNLHTHKDKSLDIIAHSCGGLVTRWMIEQEGAKDFVNNLTMLATPNAGSLFGKVESYRSFSLKMLELAANLVPNIIPGVGLAVKVLKFAGNLTPALGQMSPDSEFLTKLNTSKDPEVQYNLAAASSDGTDNDSQAIDIIKRLYQQTGKAINTDDLHDLFVKTTSVYLNDIFDNRSVPSNYTELAKGHHFGFIQKLKL